MSYLHVNIKMYMVSHVSFRFSHLI